MKKIIMAAALITALLLVFTGCSNSDPNASASPSATASASAEAASPSPSPTVSSVAITVEGSDYVSALVTELGSPYMDSNSAVTVNTTASNSNTAIASVADGNADIALSSRPLKNEEKTLFPTLKEDVICMDGLAVVVSKDSPISSLTAQQVKDIFMGTTTDWKDVGAAEGKIALYAMGEDTDISKRFNEQFLGTDEQGTQNDTSAASAAADNADMAETVGGDALAIGYMPLSAIPADGNVKAIAIDGVAAAGDTVKSGAYVYVLKYIMITNGPSAEVQAFLDYCKGTVAQAAMATKGLLIP